MIDAVKNVSVHLATHALVYETLTVVASVLKLLLISVVEMKR